MSQGPDLSSPLHCIDGHQIYFHAFQVHQKQSHILINVLVMPEIFTARKQFFIDTYAPLVKVSSLCSGKSASYLW